MRGLGQKLRGRAADLQLSDADIARRVGITPKRYNNYANDIREPDLETFLRICNALSATPNEMFGVDAPANDEFALVPVYDVRAAAGAGAVAGEENIKHRISFRYDWLRSATDAAIADLAVIEASGESMAPTIGDGDHLLVDLSQKRVARDGIYVIRLDDGVLVKRVTVDPVRRTATLSSDNPNYQPLMPVSLKDMQVLGRVLWIGKRA